MTQPDAAAGTDVGHPRPTIGIVALASGLLVIFAAFGFGAWFSGLASWVGFYLGARGRTLTGLAQWTACVGFALAVVVTLTWYARRCRRGATDISLRTVLVACLVLPVGNICWAIFADAIAYHYGQDVVRPAFDLAVMYLMLGGLLPLAVGVPWQVMRLQRRYAPRAAGADPAAG
ncbi:MAG TPA: hypothetical protein VFB66_17685 [Tepidisphaeraceae bacterium]|nr:hypothetical protein [Tepidisphaeraceae bacterium]